MPRLSILTAAPVPLRLAGRTLVLTPLSLLDYGEIEQAVLLEREASCAESANVSPAVPTMVSSAEMAAWMCGPGLAYVLWQTLRKRHAELTLDDCRALVANEPDKTTLAWQIDQASGLPPGNVRRQARPRRLPTSLAA